MTDEERTEAERINELWKETNTRDLKVKEDLAEEYYGGPIEMDNKERVKLPLSTRAAMHGCTLAACWNDDYKRVIDNIMKHTDLDRSEAFQFVTWQQLLDNHREATANARYFFNTFGPKPQEEEPWK